MQFSVPGPVSGYNANAAASSVAVGDSHTAVLFSDGTVGCAGYNSFGQLGVGHQTDSPVLLQVLGGLTNVISISAAYAHTCAVKQDGDVFCWRWAGYGQLGLPGSGMDFKMYVCVISQTNLTNSPKVCQQ